MESTTLGEELAHNPVPGGPEGRWLSRSPHPRARTTSCPSDQPVRRWVIATAEAVFARYGYRRIDTPTFEETRLFTRGVGESTDIVRKEMYTFEDLGGRSMTLRPEGTAPVARAYVEHGMHTLAAAGEALLPLPHVPLREPAVGSLPPALPAGGGGLRLGGAGAGRRGHRRAGRALPGARARRRSICGSTPWAAASAARPTPPRCGPSWRRGEADSVRRVPGAGAAQPAADLRLQGARLPGGRWTARRGCPTTCAPPAPSTTPGSRTAWRCRASPSRRTTRWSGAWTTTPAPRSSSSRPLLGAQSGVGGGGRYDDLVEAIGGPPTPGVGFGTGVERILLALSRSARRTCPRPPARTPTWWPSSDGGAGGGLRAGARAAAARAWPWTSTTSGAAPRAR